MKKRVMTLVGGILGTVINAVITTLLAIGIVAILDLLGGATGSAFFAVVSLVILAVSVLALIFNAIAITGWSSAEKFKKRKGIIITAIVFNFIIAIYYLYSLITVEGAAGVALVEYIFFMLIPLAAAVLYIVDLCLEKKRLAAEAQAQEPSQEQK